MRWFEFLAQRYVIVHLFKYVWDSYHVAMLTLSNTQLDTLVLLAVNSLKDP